MKYHSFHAHRQNCHPVFCTICKAAFKKKDEYEHFASAQHSQNFSVQKSSYTEPPQNLVVAENDTQMDNFYPEMSSNSSLEINSNNSLPPGRPLANPETMYLFSLIKKYPFVPNELWDDILILLSRISKTSTTTTDSTAVDPTVVIDSVAVDSVK